MELKIAVTATPSPARPAPLLLFGPLDEAFRQAAEWRCQGVELHFASAADLDPRQVRSLASRYGLAVPTLGTGMAAAEGLSFSDPDPDVRARAARRVRGHIRFAAEIGSAVTIGSLSGRLGVRERAARRARAIETLQQTCATAERAGVVILLEPLNRYECDYINTLADGQAILDEIGAPNLKLLADTFHMNIEEREPAASIRAAGAAVGHVHLADSNRQAPGHGHLDIAAVLAALDEAGYRGYLSFEILPLPEARQATRDGMDAVLRAAGRAAGAAAR